MREVEQGTETGGEAYRTDGRRVARAASTRVPGAVERKKPANQTEEKTLLESKEKGRIDINRPAS